MIAYKPYTEVIEMTGFFTLGKRIFILIILNILIVTTAMIVVSIVFSYLGISINDYPVLFYAVFYSVIGMGGSFLSLYLSIFFAKKAFGVRIFQPPLSGEEQKVYEMVSNLSQKAGLPKVPQVGIYNSPEVNAFATGPSKRKSLVAVSSGLLKSMDDDEVEGVIAHEISHIANGDMVTMALIQGMVNTMVLILARLATQVVTSRMERRSFFLEYTIFMLFQVVLNILGSILVVNVFSRWREYRADHGAARLSGKGKIIKALQKLGSLRIPSVSNQTASYNTFKISHQKHKQSFIQTLFSTHPPLHLRIQRLERFTRY